jgi:hypothetical protein
MDTAELEKLIGEWLDWMTDRLEVLVWDEDWDEEWGVYYRATYKQEARKILSDFLDYVKEVEASKEGDW